jgi:hypothetical protein
MPLYFATRALVVRLASITGGATPLPANALALLNRPLEVLGDPTTVVGPLVTMEGSYELMWDADPADVEQDHPYRPLQSYFIRPVLYIQPTPPAPSRPYWHNPWGAGPSPQDRTRMALAMWHTFFRFEGFGVATTLTIATPLRVLALAGQPRGDVGPSVFGTETPYRSVRGPYDPADWS